ISPQLPDALREFVPGGSGGRRARGAGVRGDLSESTAHLIELPENLREVGAQGGVPRDGPERALLELAGEPVDLEPGEGELRSEVEQSAAALVGEGVEHAYAGKQGVERSAEGERLVRQRVELGERRAADRISGSEYRGIRAAGIDVDDRVFEEARGREACGAVGADEGLNGPGDPDGDGDSVAVRVGRREQFDPGDRPDRPSCEPDGRAGYEPGRGGIGDDE